MYSMDRIYFISQIPTSMNTKLGSSIKISEVCLEYIAVFSKLYYSASP